MQEALADLFGRYEQTRHQDLTQDWLVLEVDLFPLPAK
jgi:hypothetical protein